MRPPLWLAAFLAAAVAAAGAYRVEDVPRPPELRGGISGVAFTPAGSLVLATRYGELWMRAPDGSSWHRFARGLNEPMGIIAESEQVVYVAHRPELLRVSDSDGDGEADMFDVLGENWGLSNNYHEFFFGLRRDQAGNFYGAISLDSSGDKSGAPATRGQRVLKPAVEKAYHNSEMPYRGWAVKITPDGRAIPFASGLRQPNGVGLSPEGEMFVTDNQGDYKPSCGLIHIEEGKFYGHAESLKWEPAFKPGSLTPDILWHRYTPQAVSFPQGALGVSSGEPVWDLTGGHFGPYAKQIFVGDFTNLVTRVMLEKVAGAYQGAAFSFLGRNETAPYATGVPLSQGNVRMAFAPDGSLYIGQTAGWGGGADGLQRVVWDGTMPTDVQAMHLTDKGFALTFTQPMNAELAAQASSYEVSRFRYYYQIKYGSPRIDEEKVPVAHVRLSADGRQAEIELAELKVGFVYELSLTELRTREGNPLANPIGYYTANRLQNGEIATGGVTRLPRKGEMSLGAKEAEASQSPEQLVANGAKVYSMFCVACHQLNGKGMVGGAANFVDDKTRLGKNDEQLLKSITKGTEKGMPAFGSTLKRTQQHEVLAYIRATFGGTPVPNPSTP